MDLAAIGLLLAGSALLIVSAGALVEGGVAIARRFGVSSMLVGLTIVALGTSAPELAVGIQGSLQGANDVVIGNVVGSNVLNILVVLGISSLVAPVAVRHLTLRRDIPFVTVSSIAVLLLSLDGILDLGEGLLLLMAGAAFSLHIYRTDRLGRATVATEQTMNWLQDRHVILQAGAIAVGIGGLVLGGKWMVDGGVTLAESIGISERIIGLTIVAIGTSLPELATALVAAHRKEVDLAVGNLVGSNVFNLLIVLGAAVVVRPVGVSAAMVHYDMPVMIFVSLLLLQLAHKGMKVGRSQGGILLAVYAVYLVVLLGDVLP